MSTHRCRRQNHSKWPSSTTRRLVWASVDLEDATLPWTRNKRWSFGVFVSRLQHHRQSHPKDQMEETKRWIWSSWTSCSNRKTKQMITVTEDPIILTIRRWPDIWIYISLSLDVSIHLTIGWSRKQLFNGQEYLHQNCYSSIFNAFYIIKIEMKIKRMEKRMKVD